MKALRSDLANRIIDHFGEVPVESFSFEGKWYTITEMKRLKKDKMKTIGYFIPWMFGKMFGGIVDTIAYLHNRYCENLMWHRSWAFMLTIIGLLTTLLITVMVAVQIFGYNKESGYIVSNLCEGSLALALCYVVYCIFKTAYRAYINEQEHLLSVLKSREELDE